MEGIDELHLELPDLKMLHHTSLCLWLMKYSQG